MRERDLRVAVPRHVQHVRVVAAEPGGVRPHPRAGGHGARRAGGGPGAGPPTAMEGLALGPASAGLVAPDADGLAHAILRLHDDAALNQACRDEGLAFVGTHCAAPRIMEQLRAALAA